MESTRNPERALGVAYQIPRDSLALLMVAQALAMIPLATHLSPWILGVGLFCGYWRWMVFQGRWNYPRRWVKSVLVACSAVGVSFLDARAFSAETAAALLIVAFALKLLETKSRRDAYLVIFLGYFVIATEFLFNQTMAMAAYEAVAFIAVTAAMVGLNQMHTKVRPLRSVAVSATLFVQAAPLMIVLFLFFPRVSPLWAVPLPGTGSTGLSDRSTPGDIARLTQSDEIAFRVVFDGAIPDPRGLYWRAMVYSRFAEGEWSLGPLPSMPRDDDAPAEGSRFLPDPSQRPSLGYEVLAEPSQATWLFGMDVAVPGSPAVAVMRDFRLQSAHPLTTALRYRVASYPSAIMDATLPRWMRKRETALPEDDNPRVVAFARTLRAAARDERDLIARILDIIRDGPYVYTLEPTPLSRRNSVDEFWFDTRRGFCAHYAGAFVYLMRAAGIPARMVGGYLGGEVNPITGHVVVRQYDAHAWAEVWLEGAGWVRVDPTAAVAPARIESGLMDALSEADRASLSLFATARLGAAWFSDALHFFESIDHRWNLWVVGYDASVQSQFLGDLLGDVTPTTTGLALLAGGAASLGLVVGSLFWRRRREVLHPGMSAFKRFSNGIARQGLVRRLDETPSMFVRRLGAERGLATKQVDSLVELLESVLYNPAADQSPRSIRRLKRGLRRFSMASALRTAG